MGIVMTEDGDVNREFVKAARALHGGRWLVPLAQRAGTTTQKIDIALQLKMAMPEPIVRALLEMIDEHAARLQRRRDALVRSCSDRGMHL